MDELAKSPDCKSGVGSPVVVQIHPTPPKIWDCSPTGRDTRFKPLQVMGSNPSSPTSECSAIGRRRAPQERNSVGSNPSTRTIMKQSPSSATGRGVWLRTRMLGVRVPPRANKNMDRLTSVWLRGLVLKTSRLKGLGSSSLSLSAKFNAGIAQTVEQGTCNAQVTGSIPVAGSKIWRGGRVWLMTAVC